MFIWRVGWVEWKGWKWLWSCCLVTQGQFWNARQLCLQFIKVLTLLPFRCSRFLVVIFTISLIGIVVCSLLLGKKKNRKECMQQSPSQQFRCHHCSLPPLQLYWLPWFHTSCQLHETVVCCQHKRAYSGHMTCFGWLSCLKWCIRVQGSYVWLCSFIRGIKNIKKTCCTRFHTILLPVNVEIWHSPCLFHDP